MSKIIFGSKREVGAKFLFSLIYPFGAFLYSWKDLKSRSTYYVFFFFIIIYGLSFRVNYEAADSFRYVQEFNNFTVNASQNFANVVDEYLSSGSEIKDVYVYLLYYLTSILADDNYHVFFCLVAIVFGFFYLQSLKVLTSDESFNNAPVFILLGIIFSLSNPISNINGVRFWTATWIAVYATFEFLLFKDKRYLLLFPILPLIHGSYYIYLFFFIVAFFVRHFYKLLPFLFFFSFFVTDIALQLLPNLTDYLPPFLRNMVWSYTESEYALSRMAGEDVAQEALYARILMAIPRYFHILLIFLLVRSQNHFKDEKSKEFLGFILAVGTLVNMSSMIPSVIRFWKLLIPFYIYLWVHNSHIMNRYKHILYLYPIIALYPIFRGVRFVIWTTDPFLFISNAIHIIANSL